MYKQLDLKFTENWMKLLKEQINDVRLVDLKIPGSHNSNTYSFSALGDSFAQNQVWTVEKQLQYGIRSLDLRYGLDKKKELIIDKHGPISGKNFFESIKQVKKFLQFHASEFIIIKVQAESCLDPYQKNIFKQQILKHIGQYLIDKNDTWFDLNKVTMKEIFQRNKRIFLVCSDYLTDFIDYEEVGFFQKEGNYISTWHDTDSRKKLFEENKQILMERSLEHHDKLFVNEMILTTQRSTTNIFRRLVSIGLPTIENMVVRINEKNQVMNFIIKNRKQPFNIILLDRIDYKPLIVLIIIILNIKSKLEIIKSFYKNQDITIKTQQCIFDDNYIYIQNINAFFPYKIEEQKNLNLIYRYNDSQNMLYQRNNLFQTLILYDNPLVKIEYENINAFFLIVQSQRVIAKYISIKNEEIDKKEKEIINKFMEVNEEIKINIQCLLMNQPKNILIIVQFDLDVKLQFQMKILFFLSLFIYSINSKYCERDLMHTHGLTGYHKAKEELNPYCQTIKWNCCKKKDLIKIFEQYSTQMVPTLDNFYAQMRSSLQKLTKLHDQMTSIKYKDSENQKKKFFCQKAQTEFQQFQFEPMFKNLHQGLERSILEFKPFHQSYYCALCDADAHKHFDLQARKVNLDSRNCTNHIRKNKDFIQALNIQLIDYLEKMQNLLDCSFYERHFEFPFLFDYQEQFRKQTQICLSNFDEESNEISENCKLLCDQLNIAGIAPHFEGSPKFLDKALDYYENLIEEIELEKLKKAENPSDPKKTPKYNPMIHIDEMNHREPPVNVKLVGNNQASRLLKQIKKNRKYADIFDKNKKKAIKRSGPRILEEQRKSHIRKIIRQEKQLTRILEAKAQEEKPAKKDPNALTPEQIKHYKDIYENMPIRFHPESQEIFKRTIDPYDIQKFQKFYLYEQGLNFFDYLKGLNFDLNKEEILRTVHGHKKTETLDYDSQVILDSIKEPSIASILEDLTKDCLFIIPDDLQNKNHQNLVALPSAELDPEESMKKIEEVVEKEIKENEEKEKEVKEEKKEAKKELEKTSETQTAEAKPAEKKTEEKKS